MRPLPESARALLLLLKQDPLPKKFEITVLPIDSNEKSATNYFLKVDIHLGIDATKLPGLLREFREDYFTLRPIFARSQHNTPKVGKQDLCSLNQRFVDSTTCFLMLCPDHAMAWSDRKISLLISNSSNVEDDNSIECHQSIWKEELMFLDMLFSQHSKAPNAWAHRKWVCRQIVENIQTKSHKSWEILLSWTRNEIEQCIIVAEHFPKNYYAWTHRSFLIRTLVDLWTSDASQSNHLRKNDDVSVDLLLTLLQGEVNLINPWLRRHVSDHSAAHYGGEVLRTLLRFADFGLESNKNKTKWKIQVIQEQLDESRRLALFFRSHEVIWIWRRICSQILLLTLADLSSHNTENHSKIIITDAVHKFVDIDIYKTFENCSSLMRSNCDDEHRLCVLHSSTFIMWVLEHSKRNKINNLMKDDYNLGELESNLLGSLAKDEKISHNMWRKRAT